MHLWRASFLFYSNRSMIKMISCIRKVSKRWNPRHRSIRSLKITPIYGTSSKYRPILAKLASSIVRWALLRGKTLFHNVPGRRSTWILFTLRIPSIRSSPIRLSCSLCKARRRNLHLPSITTILHRRRDRAGSLVPAIRVIRPNFSIRAIRGRPCHPWLTRRRLQRMEVSRCRFLRTLPRLTIISQWFQGSRRIWSQWLAPRSSLSLPMVGISRNQQC